MNDIAVPAFHAAADTVRYPDAGDPWAPSKLYYSIWSHERMVRTHEKCLELYGESPYKEQWFERESEDGYISTKIDVEAFWDQRCDALLAHATQVDPDEKLWFPLPREIAASVYPWDDYELAISHVATELPEHDLFAGIRQPAPASP